MLLQTGPIAPSSIGLWALTFVLGGLVVVVGWLVRRHFNYAVPAYERIFGTDEDDTADGHLVNSYERFNTIDDSVAHLDEEVDDIRRTVRKVERHQDTLLSNQSAIADELGVDLQQPRVFDASAEQDSSGDSDTGE